MKPLADVRILAVEQFGAGPFGSVHLADLGADVIKIEDPTTRGDVGRYVGPHQVGDDSLFFETFNRNKKSITLDLASEAGRDVFHDLVRVSDVVYSNLRGDVPQRLGLRYADLSTVNPAIVCVSLSGYGSGNSREKRPGYDYLFQGEAGWMSLTGEPNGPPAKSGLSLVDFSAGYVAALSVMAALHAARRDGVGMDCDLSLYDVAINMTAYLSTWYLTAGDVPERVERSAHPSLVPFQNFPTATSWIVVGCAKDKFWTRLCGVLDRADLAVDERFVDFVGRRANRAALVAELDRVFMTKSADIWLAELEAADVPCAPIRSVPEALDDEFTQERGLIVETTHPHWGVVRQIRSPVRVGDGSNLSYRSAPTLGEDNAEVWRMLGYQAAEISRLTSLGAFGTT